MVQVQFVKLSCTYKRFDRGWEQNKTKRIVHMRALPSKASVKDYLRLIRLVFNTKAGLILANLNQPSVKLNIP